MTAGEIVAALRRHLDLQRLSVFKAGDFKKGEACNAVMALGDGALIRRQGRAFVAGAPLEMRMMVPRAR
jgi:hypothetical protein